MASPQAKTKASQPQPVVTNQVKETVTEVASLPPISVVEDMGNVMEMPLTEEKNIIITNEPLILDSEQEVGEDYVWDYEEWYRENVLLYINTAIHNPVENIGFDIAIPNVIVFNTNNLCTNAMTFYNVVLSYTAYQPLKRTHFNAFLKDVGGAKLKMTTRGYIQIKLDDKSVETKYALPNLTSSRMDQPYMIFTIHQPHGDLEFPRRTIFEFFRFQLPKAGYTS